MWLVAIIAQLWSICLYFWDVGLDILVGKEGFGKTFPEIQDDSKGTDSNASKGAGPHFKETFQMTP